MFTKEYETSTKLTLRDGDIEHTLELIIDGDDFKFLEDGDERIYDEGEPENYIDYLNCEFKIDEFNRYISLDNFNVDNSPSKIELDLSKVSFPIVNYRFKDGYRDIIYFSLTNSESESRNVSIKFDYNENGTIKTKVQTYTFENVFRGTLNNNEIGYFLIPKNGKVQLLISKNVPNEPIYICFAKMVESDITNEKTLTLATKYLNNKNGDSFNIENNDGEVLVCYDDSKNILKNFEDNTIRNNVINFGESEYINGLVNVYKFVNSENEKLYSYISSCLITKLYPKIEVNIEKHNTSDLDYVVNGDRSNNSLYSISKEILNNGLVLLKDYSAAENSYDIPLYDAKVSSYIPKSFIDEGYDLSSTHIKIGNENTNYELTSYNDSEYIITDMYHKKTETFEVNPNTISQNMYWYSSISSTNDIVYNEKYYIKGNYNKYLDYSEHSININEDNRIVYYK